MYKVRNVLSSTIVYLPFDLFLPPRLLPALKPPETKETFMCVNGNSRVGRWEIKSFHFIIIKS